MAIQNDRGLIPGEEGSRVKSGSYTVGTTVVSIDIPDYATAVKIYPQVNNVRIAFDEDPVAVGTDELTVGGFALAGQVEVRTIRKNNSTLRLLGTADTTVLVELIGG